MSGSNLTAFRAIAIAIFKGFMRDRSSVFFALVFPLMFLVLFGGVFADPQQSKVDLIQIGAVPLVDDMPAEGKEAFRQAFEVHPCR